MDQRRLRPGDRLDDYCPRERRLTDHVVVAVVDDTIKQTRCVACDAEHAYKGGKVPPRRKKKDDVPVLAGPPVADDLPAARPAVAPPAPDEEPIDEDAQPGPLPNLVMRPEPKPAKGKRAVPAPPPAPPAPDPAPPQLAASPDEDEGPVHRRLIRATLPRPEGQAPVRPLPEFTIRQPGARGHTNGVARGGGQGQRFGNKPGGFRQGQGQGGGFGQGHGQGAWNGRSSGQGGHRPGASAQGQGPEARGRHKAHRSRNARKKAR